MLGIGGVRALAALNIEPTVFHMNEGHSAFLALERIRVLLEEQPRSTFDEARQLVMATNVFTTHTPVPAGIDMFPPDMMLKYFREYYPVAQARRGRVPGAGPRGRADRKQGFSMALLAIRLADRVNGVSELHGKVSPEDVA